VAPALAHLLEVLHLLLGQDLGELGVGLLLQRLQLFLLLVGQAELVLDVGRQKLVGGRGAAEAAGPAATGPAATGAPAAGPAALVLRRGRDSDEDLVAPDDRLRPATSGEFGLPLDVLVGAPLGGELLLVADGGAARPAERRPLVAAPDGRQPREE